MTCPAGALSPGDVVAGFNVDVREHITTLGLHAYLRHCFDRAEVREGDPPVTRLSNVIADPRSTALYDADGNILPESSLYVMPPNAPQVQIDKFRRTSEKRKFEPDRIEVSDLDVCDETVAFGGASHNHFGHHLLDGMCRLWYHSEHPTLYLDALPRWRGHQQFISEFRNLGRPRREYPLNRRTLFKELILPHASVQNSFLFYSSADTEHVAIARSVLDKGHAAVAPKIYLSRRGIDNRRCHGEDELEALLVAEGFVSVRPETLGIVDQIAMFNCAEWIVGLTGSAFHNLLFTRPGAATKIVQFTARKTDLRYVMVDRIKKQPSFYVETMTWEAAGGKIASAHIDPTRSVNALRAIGAL